jgi:hypothetical protein
MRMFSSYCFVTVLCFVITVENALDNTEKSFIIKTQEEEQPLTVVTPT